MRGPRHAYGDTVALAGVDLTRALRWRRVGVGRGGRPHPARHASTVPRRRSARLTRGPRRGGARAGGSMSRAVP
ncbi:hypothetical protein [Amycolatopsis arida]|uniref:hypothetical protein n=1 Tax=Amycolatopsis arida TaxID=587909 RepID=UPI0010670BE5|nr:hypothetical protein [Amycolatopsis arida]